MYVYIYTSAMYVKIATIYHSQDNMHFMHHMDTVI